MEWKQTIRETAGKAAHEAQKLAKIAKLNLHILSEEDKIKKAQLELGKLCHRDHVSAVDSDPAAYLPWHEKIEASDMLIAALRSEIEVLRLQAAEACPCVSTADDSAAPAAGVCDEVPVEEGSSALIAKLREENASLTMCYTELTSKCAVLEEKLRAYEVEKLRLGEIEEAAHRNAEKIEAQAHEKAAASLESLSARVSAMQDLLADVSRGIDNTTRAIYAELSECGMRYSALRRTADDLRAELNAMHPSK